VCAKMAQTILVVDDDRTFVKLMEGFLEDEGYRVVTAGNGAEGLQRAFVENPDLAILDVRMPEMDGLELCRRIRDRSHIPIIMLTAKADETDVVVGLELGADDYVTKPFGAREVLARVRAQLRRTKVYDRPGEDANCIVQSGDLWIDRGAHVVKVGGQVVNLRPLEFRLLTFLAERPNRVQSRDDIQQGVWQEDVYVDSRTLDVHIRRLREKIETDPARPEHVITVRGFGYKFL